MLTRTRRFFADRSVLEVETPVLTRYGVTEPHISSTRYESNNHQGYLRSSPEYFLKRLLAAGCPDMYEIARVFRDGETGTRHQPEFTLVEWYRRDLSMMAMLEETGEFIDELAREGGHRLGPIQVHDYQSLFESATGLDPLLAECAQLKAAAHELLKSSATEILNGPLGQDRQFCCDLIMSHHLSPSLGQDGLEAVTGFPAAQASLARLNPENPAVAERFEIFWQGVELANGFRELTDAGEQEHRFRVDQDRRRQLSLKNMPLDRQLLSALSAGLPECAGVAVGFDRVVMLTLGLDSLAESQAFPA